MANAPDNEPKIIVDEDWKTQVEREKQQAQAAKDDPDSEASAQNATGELPPASFQIHVSSLATQVLVALGQLNDPIEGKPRINFEFAKFVIDTIAMLQEKTKNNLSDEEAVMLEESLHQLRMIFVAVKDQPPQS